MSLGFVRRLAAFVLLVLAQVQVLNHIHLVDCATPLIYVYFVVSMRRDTARWASLLWCFFMGLCIDVFSDTPGVTAAAMTFVGFVQPYLLTLFVQRDSVEDLVPTFHTLGIGKYVLYVLILVTLYCLAFFSLEVFNFYNVEQWLECVGGSLAVTFVLILAVENLVKRK